MPAVSAIITTFNRADYLKKAIESVIAQTFTDFELLILDNSSNDNTEEVVRSFNDDRIRYIKHAPMNISQARNLGVKEAKGQYVAFLDDDDEWLPTKIDQQVNKMAVSDKDTVLVYGGFVRIDSEGKEFYKCTPRLRGKVLKGLLWLDEFTGSASNPLIKRAVIERLGGFDENIVTGEDWEFYLRLTEKYEVDFINEPVIKIRHHSGPRLANKLKEYAEFEKYIVERYKYIFETDRKLYSFYLQRIGGKFVRLGEIDTGRKYFIKAILSYPLNYIAIFQYLLSLMGNGLYLKFHQRYLANRRRWQLL